MLIRLGYDIRFVLSGPVTFITALNVHPSRWSDLREPDNLQLEPVLPVETYFDFFGNRCCRFQASAGELRLINSTLIEDSGLPDAVICSAKASPVQELPSDVLQFLLPSRYCESDLLSSMAWRLFGNIPRGWQTVQAIVEWTNHAVRFDYQSARPTKTAVDVMNEGRGVCRDFQHLAISMCRSMNIPARYATGYLPDIQYSAPPPMDFSAWFEVYLDGKWWTFDARHNKRRIGRILMATGRDAGDVAITTSFGSAILTHFTVVSDEVSDVVELEPVVQLVG